MRQVPVQAGEDPSGFDLAQNLFRDSQSVERDDDNLQMHYGTKQVAKRIWRENFRPRMKILSLAGIAMVFSAATTGVIPLLIQRAADDIFVGQNRTIVFALTAIVIGVTLVKTVSEYVSKVSIAYLGMRFVSDLRQQMFATLTRADLGWIDDIHSGRFLSGFLTDANMIRDTASRALVALGENLVKVLFLLAAMFYLDWKLTLLMILVLPIGIWLMGRQRKKMRSSTTKTLQETGDLSALVSQTLRSIRVVRAYGQEKRELERATTAIDRMLEFAMRSMRARVISSPLVEMLTGIGFALAIYVAGTRGISGQMSLGDFMGFITAAMLIYQPVKSIAQLQMSIQEGVTAAGRVFGIIDHPVVLKDAPDAKDLMLKDGTIEFDTVDFQYNKGETILTDLSLRVEAGQTVALVGPSGSGKSTILNLVLRFYDPINGTVRIDGQNLKDITIESLRRNIALVTQEPVLFDDTIRANIAYGLEDASIEKITEAAKAAAAHDFIIAMPNGYDSKVGEAGNLLSGGERQRIAIARAFLRDAPILLLDEPTSALDSQAEAKVQHALETLMKGRTVLMIAHRLSTVKRADQICVLSNGKVAEQGTHVDLVARGGLYAKLQATQLVEQDDTAGDERAEWDDGTASNVLPMPSKHAKTAKSGSDG